MISRKVAKNHRQEEDRRVARMVEHGYAPKIMPDRLSALYEWPNLLVLVRDPTMSTSRKDG